MMKHFLLLVLFCTVLAGTAAAQQTPPQAIATAFGTLAPQASSVVWHAEGTQSWRAEYTLAGKNQIVRYNTEDHSFIERIEVMPASSVPAQVMSTLNRFDPFTLHSAGTAHRPNGTTLTAMHITYGGNTQIVIYFNDQHQMVERRLTNQ